MIYETFFHRPDEANSVWLVCDKMDCTLFQQQTVLNVMDLKEVPLYVMSALILLLSCRQLCHKSLYILVYLFALN